MTLLCAPPLSLYVHFPWCVKKCPYCDFNSHTLKGALPEEDYIRALIQNLDQSLDDMGEREIATIFMGGGTPSLFSEKSIATLLDEIRHRTKWRSNIEITLEANPGTVEQQRFKGYFQAGVNRVSLGIQSLNDIHLKALGRIHSADNAKRAMEAVKMAGFERINIDIMFGLPEQTLEEGLADLNQGLALEPSHLSWYELTIEPNTLFWHTPPHLPEEDNIIELHTLGQKVLKEHGMAQYEVSAYTREQPCHHNVNYWEFGDYLAIGAGAHGKITHPDRQEIIRYHHYRSPKQYMDRTLGFIQGKQAIPSDQLAFEFMLNALRLKQGVKTTYFTERTGLPLSSITSTLDAAKQKGWLEAYSTHLRATPEGYRFLNDLVGMFISDHEN